MYKGSERRIKQKLRVKTNRKECNCWFDKNRRLKEQGYTISDACKTLEITEENKLKPTFGLPLVRTDGKRLKRSDANMITISYCPFCGEKLDKEPFSPLPGKESDNLE